MKHTKTTFETQVKGLNSFTAMGADPRLNIQQDFWSILIIRVNGFRARQEQVYKTMHICLVNHMVVRVKVFC